MYMKAKSGDTSMAAQVNIVEVRSKLADTINRVAYGGERVVLERRGQGVAALVSMEDLDLIEALEDQADVRAALKARREKGQVPLSAIKARLRMK
jgi:prevent-host-death family protein